MKNLKVKKEFYESASEFIRQHKYYGKNLSLGTVANLIIEWDKSERDPKEVYEKMIKDGYRVNNVFTSHSVLNVMSRYHVDQKIDFSKTKNHSFLTKRMIMAKIKKLEKYKGELNGTYQTLWVATSENGNYFTTHDLELKQIGNKVVNDIASTKWTHITNEHHHKITEEMHCVETKNYSLSSVKPKHEVPNKVRKDKGMSMGM